MIKPRDRFTIEDKQYEVFEVYLGKDNLRKCVLREYLPAEHDFDVDGYGEDEVIMNEEDLVELQPNPNPWS